jgi:hypothetical protein
MRIRATCDKCGRDFLFLQLYRSDPWHIDRCPHCNTHLGVVNLKHLAHVADRALAGLVSAMTEIADRSPAFTLRPESVLGRLQDVTIELTAGNEPPTSLPEEHGGVGNAQREAA